MYSHHCVSELFFTIFIHLNLELLMQFAALNDEKYVYSIYEK